jgi:hypothetical protein
VSSRKCCASAWLGNETRSNNLFAVSFALSLSLSLSLSRAYRLVAFRRPFKCVTCAIYDGKTVVTCQCTNHTFSAKTTTVSAVFVLVPIRSQTCRTRIDRTPKVKSKLTNSRDKLAETAAIATDRQIKRLFAVRYLPLGRSQSEFAAKVAAARSRDKSRDLLCARTDTLKQSSRTTVFTVASRRCRIACDRVQGRCGSRNPGAMVTCVLVGCAMCHLHALAE